MGDELIGVSRTGGVAEAGRVNGIGADIDAAERDRNDDSDLLLPKSRCMEGRLDLFRVDPERERFGADLRGDRGVAGVEGKGMGGEITRAMRVEEEFKGSGVW